MIEFKKLSDQKRNFSIKLFVSYIVFTVILMASIIGIHIYFSYDLNYKKFEREISMQSSDKIMKAQAYLKSKEGAIKAVAADKKFLECVSGDQDYLNLLFSAIMQANKDYTRIVYVSKTGHEILGYERTSEGYEAYKISKFKEEFHSNKAKEGEIALNFRLDKKFKRPSLRLEVPIYADDEFKGELVIDAFMDGFIDSLTMSMIYDVFLIDSEGYYIKHKDPKFDWSLYADKRKIEDDFKKELAGEIYRSGADGFIYENVFVQPFFIGKQKFYLVMEGSKPSLNDMENNKMIASILIFATIMSVIFTFVLTRPIRGIFAAVAKRADELGELATNLDNTITLKTLEIAQKDRLLQNQNKFAELGELIGNIAHQWRQPLTRLSLILQNLRAFKRKNKMSDESFYEAVENSLRQIEFMTSTVENFRNFYKKDDAKREFSVKSAVEDILGIIGAIIEHSHIRLEVSCAEDIFILANKNEFSQVLMNILINAKDAIDERALKNGLIKITATKKEDEILIQIEDNAGGIDAAIMQKIFDPYFTTKKDKGTGIGLYIANTIVKERLGGSLSVQNTNDGAVFRIVLKGSFIQNDVDDEAIS
ncbi:MULTISPECIES: sensor histidine kinase [Campylobacter]|uniref:histidine kinase n=1 Tax=Campylobacter curvus (strain 525.92) TaxID=360105 RepID=A7GWL5_CAMC5|nr:MULTISPECIES: sensor histidine kinase [Campylobacter]EAT99876.1 two-component system sensor histidine kinase [Campylobacter curvus 525.92]MDU6827896.1 sensor histidine kinase [Campylobacter sp.]